MAVHDLKSWPEFFQPLQTSQKNFELRFNDRGFHIGDILVLREWDPMTHNYTGRFCERRVTYVMEGIGTVGVIPPLKGLVRGYVILGLAGRHSQESEIEDAA